MQPYQTSIDSVAFELKAPFDFSFLGRWGRVFQVFDHQDSGNICFGMQRDEEKLFIKFAGAPTKRSCVTAQQAIAHLKATVPLYQALKHPNLIELLETCDIGSGFAMVFRWQEGECMGRMYPASHAKFMAMPMGAKLQVFEDIQRFFAHVHRQGYVAIDFYDGSILYDFAAGRTAICDIDFFRPKPCVNDMGRMWGSSRFQSPEEYQLGADIDEITNVYTLGATAFALLADYQREQQHWRLSNELYTVASTAINPDRAQRQQTIDQFIAQWQAAKGTSPA